MRRLAMAAGLVVFTYLLKMFFQSSLGIGDLPPSVALGFILLAGFSFAKALSRLKLPLITGYMFMGLIAGPYMLNLITPETVGALKLIDEIAIALIAMTAGGEMQVATLRRKLPAYGIALFSLLLFVVLGYMGLCLVARPIFPEMLSSHWTPFLAAAILLSVSAAAKSPATTIAVLKESRACGPLSEWTLNTLILLDATVIVLFSFALTFAEGLVGEESLFQASELLWLLGHMGGAVIAGLALGAVALLFLKHTSANHTLFIILITILAVQTANVLHLDLLIMAVVMGFVVENASKQGHRMLNALERGGAPVYVIFFTIVGADVRLDFLAANWTFALTSALAIGLLTWAGIGVGSRLARENTPIRKLGWTGFISQAGVNLSFAVVIGERFDAMGLHDIGAAIKTLIIARVAVNQIAGPILFRWGLSAANEIDQPPAWAEIPLRTGETEEAERESEVARARV